MYLHSVTTGEYPQVLERGSPTWRKGLCECVIQVSPHVNGFRRFDSGIWLNRWLCMNSAMGIDSGGSVFCLLVWKLAVKVSFFTHRMARTTTIEVNRTASCGAPRQRSISVRLQCVRTLAIFYDFSSKNERLFCHKDSRATSVMSALKIDADASVWLAPARSNGVVHCLKLLQTSLGGNAGPEGVQNTSSC